MLFERTISKCNSNYCTIGCFNIKCFCFLIAFKLEFEILNSHILDFEVMFKNDNTRIDAFDKRWFNVEFCFSESRVKCLGCIYRSILCYAISKMREQFHTYTFLLFPSPNNGKWANIFDFITLLVRLGSWNYPIDIYNTTPSGGIRTMFSYCKHSHLSVHYYALISKIVMASKDMDDQECPNKFTTKSKPHRTLKLAVAFFLLAVITYVIVDSFTSHHVRDLLQQFLEWTTNNPVLGVFAFTLVYMVSTGMSIKNNTCTKLNMTFVF